ncbi:carcinoembryonic antigen-related cell adhesion molecule 1 isoform X4 [Fukomys damarensis]|uniref:carcinoembryonic antigen-related cell adhesion molecule 1 isoform X4 n=1 Tax=Fukomys damarensis TaxID=885580 RepID=UPI00053F4483|nr:carcinoembryonic antigen-related cell adhesion molecule 1 isoform X4 [Fukomys damarensis]
METRSATSHRGLLPWQGLLLAASLLTFWNPPTTAQMTIDSVPSDAAEGGDVLLLVRNLSANSIAYSWFKGETVTSNNQIAAYLVADGTTTQGPAYSHRETIYPNGSLLFRNVILGDTGVYTLQVTQPNFLTEIASGQFRVHQPVSPPSIQATNTTVAEEDSVVLTCLTGDTGVSIRWVRDDQPLRLTDRMTLSPNSSVLTIDPVRREDAGEYQCEVFNPVSSRRSSIIRLEVKYPVREDSDLSGGAIAGIVVAVVAGVALIGALAYFLFFRKIGRASDQHDLTEHKPSVSSHSLGPSDNSPNKVDEIAYSSLNFSALQPKPLTSDSPSPTITETVYSEVKKK